MQRRVAIGMFLSAPVWTTTACTHQPWCTAPLDARGYDNETRDYGVPPTNDIHADDFQLPTPMTVDGATTVTTMEVRNLMIGTPPPVLIDVLGGVVTASLPGSVWIRGAGVGTSVDDPVQRRLAAALSPLTGGNLYRPLVFYCLSKTCWLSHNAAVRAVAMGYRAVYWYRGGRNAWLAAGLPLEPMRTVVL